ncbi:MAG: hypothetical protein MK171_11920 [Pirellulales bacterium]|nr:hypothetical protein [Pirellulales bacterium]
MNQAENYRSLCVGRWRGGDVRLHVLFPLLALGVVVLVHAGDMHPRVALWGLFVLLLSVSLHELVRIITAARMGGRTSTVVLAPFGGCSQLHLPADPPAHLVAALVGPMTFLALLIASACGLALRGDRDVYHLLNVLAPPIEARGVVFSITTATLVGQLMVWINTCLLLASLLPIDPCPGAELLRGILWPIVGRHSAATATSHIALLGALLAAAAALLMLKYDGGNALVPSWFPISVISVLLLYGGMQSTVGRRYDLGLAIDEFDSDDEQWLVSEWLEDDREAVLVEHLQDKKQEVLDQKRREREANEDVRVDGILQRLHHTSFEKLSEEDRFLLKRASRRYRDRRNSLDE